MSTPITRERQNLENHLHLKISNLGRCGKAQQQVNFLVRFTLISGRRAPMADYWVSNERYFCKYCKVWLSNHKASIRHHEQGKRHTEVMEEFFRKKREDKLKGAESEVDLKRQMRNIEEAALKAHEKDLAMFGGSSSHVTPPPPPPPPHGGPPVAPPPPPPGPPPRVIQPPPPPPGGPPPLQGYSSQPVATEPSVPPPPPPKPHDATSYETGSNGGEARPPLPPGPPPGLAPGRRKALEGDGGKSSGTGTMKGEGGASAASGGRDGVILEGGRWFLDGQVHQDKLMVDSSCQIFSTVEDQWVDAIIVGVSDVPVPNTAVTIRRNQKGPGPRATIQLYDVAFFEGGGEKETTAKGVPSGSLRLSAGENGAWPPPVEEGFSETPPPPPPPETDENTGYGGWQTVSVRMVDERAESEALERKRNKAEARRAKKEAAREAKTEREQ
ncbi:unnamed protein product, partial [Discosporangium mesarthrocarpum]